MNDTVAQHYAQPALLTRLLDALRAAGKDMARLSIEDLAPIDEFHSRRRRATEELAAWLAPTPGMQVVDIGSGLGGPARYLAQTFGCTVTGVDLTPDFVATATGLTEAVGLQDRVRFQVGSAVSLPFPDASFDAAWSQNVAMNIADRAAYYAEAFRVLRPGGRLAIQDVATGTGAPLDFPVMWADRPEISFLRTPEDTRRLLESAGFRVAQWADTSELSLAESAAERARARAGEAPPALGLHLVMGPSFRDRLRNAQRAMEDGRLRLIAALLVKPG
ncbi:MAG: methyltransferase domain-containing protein [Rhodospirillales bacterium]|nr:methyltransferase domain-containing protein [Rhodospirillales bacterium]